MRKIPWIVLIGAFCWPAFCQLAWAGPKKHTFDAPSEAVYVAALKVAHEQYKVEYENAEDKTFVFTTGISPLSWGMRVLATVKEVGKDKSEITLELKKKVGVLQPSQWGAGGRMADKYFDLVSSKLKNSGVQQPGGEPHPAKMP